MLERMMVNITPFNREREIIVCLPDDYQCSGKKYPVLYFNDGQEAFIDEEAFIKKSWGLHDFVINNKMDVIIVGICCNKDPNGRMNEYGPWIIDEDLCFYETQVKRLKIGGEGIAYVQWIIHELKPMIDALYPTNKDDTGIAGSSMGAVISAYASLAYPTVFKKCACLSTAFWFYENEFKHLIEHQNLDAIEAFYFDIGGDEGLGNAEENGWYRTSNAHMLALLQERIKPLYFNYIGQAKHNEWDWSKRVPIFMNFLFGGNGYV